MIMKYLLICSGILLMLASSGCVIRHWGPQSRDFTAPPLSYGTLMEGAAARSVEPDGNIKFRMGALIEAQATGHFSEDSRTKNVFVTSGPKESLLGFKSHAVSLNNRRRNSVISDAYQKLIDTLPEGWDSVMIVSCDVDTETTVSTTSITARLRARPVKLVDVSEE